MPLRDHFRSPLDDRHSWDSLHGTWPVMMLVKLNLHLPQRTIAGPTIHLGSPIEIDLAEMEQSRSAWSDDEDAGGVALTTYAPARAKLTVEASMDDLDTYELRVFDLHRGRRLVAAVEIVSPSNKDRPEHRAYFTTKVASLLKQQVCVTIVDIVTTIDFNLYAELLTLLERSDPALTDFPSKTYAVTLRTRSEQKLSLLDAWYYPLAFGQALPTMPLWLTPTLAIPLELEDSYEDACRTLRIA